MAVATDFSPLGRLIVTSGADAALAEAGEEADMFLSRHVSAILLVGMVFYRSRVSITDTRKLSAKDS